MKNEAQVYARKLRDERPVRPPNPDEYMALRKLRLESHAAGAVLANTGRGGLPSSLVLGVMRRDRYRCTIPGCGSDGHGRGGLTVHHIGGVGAPTSMTAARAGKRNTPDNLAVLCTECHHGLHDADEALEDAVDARAGEGASEGERVRVAAGLAGGDR